MIAHLSNWVILLVKEMWTSSLKIIVTHDHYSFCLLELPRNRSSSKKWKRKNVLKMQDDDDFCFGWGMNWDVEFSFNLRHMNIIPNRYRSIKSQHYYWDLTNLMAMIKELRSSYRFQHSHRQHPSLVYVIT